MTREAVARRIKELSLERGLDTVPSKLFLSKIDLPGLKLFCHALAVFFNSGMHT